MENSIHIVSEKSRTVAFLLAFFLGAFGAHRFYLAKPGSAIAMLVLTCTLIGAIVSGIWALIDVFVIGFGHARDGKGYEVKNW